ncbi:hypothetical protein GCM10010178_83160 [Lentzea flava]|uniref:DUF742 domain-containing protein n=2 Tax=Lentzea flava TaxID=103732 RepID=A0ABQ2VE34_9PSEU|nr:hypothetical protein GCM10010178_83160 [Lentzea flava]
MHDEEATEIGYTGARFGSPATRRRLRAERTHDASGAETQQLPRQQPLRQRPPEPPPEWPMQDEEPHHVPARDSALVRPYARTGGRTAARHDLRLETLLSTDEEHLYRANNDQAAMMRLCLQPRSVAEISALMKIPLGVTRVLLSDLITLGLVAVHEPGDKPNLALLERVLAGLRRL